MFAEFSFTKPITWSSQSSHQMFRNNIQTFLPASSQPHSSQVCTSRSGEKTMTCVLCVIKKAPVKSDCRPQTLI